MNRDVDLLEYLPNYVQDYREIQEIQKAVEPEVQSVDDLSDKILDNVFITSCDEDGISRYEQLLSIYPSPNDTVSDRVQRVITRWNNALPYSYKALISMLTAICGPDGFTLNPEFDKYKLGIVVSLDTSSKIEELERLMYIVIPVNIDYRCYNNLSRKVSSETLNGCAITTTRLFEINM